MKNLTKILLHKTTILAMMMVLGCFCLSPLHSQTITEYASADFDFDDFYEDLLAAEDGDEFVFIDGGAEYQLDGFADIEAHVVIRAAEGLTERPVLVNIRDQNWTHMFRIETGGALTMKGLELNGEYPFTPGVVWAIRTQSPVDENYYLVVEDCVFKNFTQSAFRAASNTEADSLIFRNSVFDNMGQNAINFWYQDAKPKVDLLEITNCTYSNVGRSLVGKTGWPDDGSTETVEVNIDHITAYNIGNSGDGWPLLNLEEFSDVSFKNSIVSYATSDTLFFLEDDAEVIYNVFSQTEDAELAEMDTTLFFLNPGFEDPANGDFTVNNALVYDKSEDEGLPGDSRWALDEIPNTYYYTAQQASEMQSHFTSAQDGDVFILTDGGSRYVLDGFPNVNANVTIKAQEGLTERPILNNKRDQGSTPMLRIHTGGSLILKDLVFDGIWMNDDDEAITTAFAIRVHGGIDDYHLIAENCHFHDFSDNAVRIDANTHADNIVFNNCVFENISGREGFRFSAWPAADPVPTFDLLEVTNSTFANINREAIKVPVADDTTSGPVIIDQVTIDNAGSGDFGILRLLTVGSTSITNSIFTNSDADIAFELDDDNVTFDYSNLFNLTDDGDYGGDNMMEVDPGYRDADNFDFTVLNSALWDAGDQGQIIGDTRWEPVIASAEEQSATNAAGQYIIAQSNQAPGYLYIIHEDEDQETIEDFENAVDNNKGAKEAVATANVDVYISTEGLEPGDYNLYAVDQYGYISDAVEGILDITEFPVEADAEPQTVTNAADEYIVAKSNKAPGYLYIILEGEDQETIDDFDSAVDNNKGAKGAVATANVDVYISTEGLEPGNYNLYAVYEDEISVPVEGVITVDPEVLPIEVIVEAQTVTNAEGETVIVQSNHDSGKVYIIKSGEDHETVADLDAAVNANKGASAEVTAAYTDILISVGGIEAGTYYAFAVDAEGDISEPGENVITIEDVVSAPDISAPEVVVNIFPNPASDRMTVESDEQINEIRMFDMLGQVVYAHVANDTSHEISLGGIKAGVYFVQLTTETSIVTQRVKVTR